jgi:hypothetical protein
VNHVADDGTAVLPTAVRFGREHKLNDLTDGKRLIRAKSNASSSDIGQPSFEYGTAC